MLFELHVMKVLIKLLERQFNQRIFAQISRAIVTKKCSQVKFVLLSHRKLDQLKLRFV